MAIIGLCFFLLKKTKFILQKYIKTFLFSQSKLFFNNAAKWITKKFILKIIINIVIYLNKKYNWLFIKN